MEKGSLSRLHYVDALRAFVMVLVIPWHAATFFAVRGQGGTFLSGWLWFTHTFRMPLFFLIAGVFGAMMIGERGSARWLRGRLTRLGIPLVVGMVALAPLAGLFATWEDQPPPGGERSLLMGLAHPQPQYLWFLWYLLIVVAVWLGLRGAIGRWALTASIQRPLHKVAASGWAIPALALPCALAVWSTGDWGPYPPNDFAAPAGLLAYYAVFFAFGWLIGGRMATLESLGRHPYRLLAMAVVVASPAFWLFAHAGDPGIASNSAIRLGALYLGALCCWLLIAGLAGLFREHLSGERPAVRYVADSSYWVYLSHMLFLAPIQLFLVGLVVPGAAKLVIAMATTLALTLITYQLFVRYSAIGRVLHGPRRKPRVRLPDTDRPTPDRGWHEVPVSPPATAAGRRA